MFTQRSNQALRHHTQNGRFNEIRRHPINSRSHRPFFPPGLYMDVTCPLAKCVLKQPINNVDDMRVIGLHAVELP